MNREDLPVRTVVVVCTSGVNTGISVPGNCIAHIKSIEVDTVAITGAISNAIIQITDTYTVTNAAVATTTVRKQVSVVCGQFAHVDEKGDVQVFTQGNIVSNVSGPVVTLGYVLE